MATAKQQLGELGEVLVAKHCICPRCKRNKTLKRLPANFKCADLVCDFCGYLAQVKASKVKDVTVMPKTILGAAWGPQKLRMDAGIYFPLFVVLISKVTIKEFGIYYLSADLQTPGMFIPRKPLSPSAKRAGWQGFYYDMQSVDDALVLLKVN
ncbi:DpnI domain-containing protein [Sneathiella glossodoripedis]|uniref:DpnI domain-containing protein n=1 Tax=Sneathiella glossodoripedis TaxID=418853 RepID=UPI00047113EB|nr:DpnI domain-containing protein [Sneathiella glossodoripedis]